jgi:hypothetical protein
MNLLKRSRLNSKGFSHVELIIAIIVVGAVAAVGVRVLKATHAETPIPSAFNVVGNKIIGHNNEQFVPYGFVLPCAANYTSPSNVSSLCQGNSQDPNTGSQIINAASTSWHANVIRLQVSQEDLFSEKTHDTCSNTVGSVNKTYANLVNSLVQQINSQKMVAIITLQEELAGGCAFPTSSSTAFWQYMANTYKSYPDVFFDLFNEPQLGSNAAGSENNIWNIWQNGGTATAQTDSSGLQPGTSVNYVGMQSLINTIRSAGANNIVIAEGNAKDQDLSQLSSHYLTGKNIAYGTEPSLRSKGGYKDITQAEWYNNWGQYATTVPVMSEAFLSQYGTDACDPNFNSDFPLLFNYLKQLNMGLISWSLTPGVDIRGTNLNVPTTFSGQTIDPSECPAQANAPAINYQTNAVGPGSLIYQYFVANSSKLAN